MRSSRRLRPALYKATLIAVSAVVIAGCGGDDSSKPATAPISSGKTPGYEQAKRACGAARAGADAAAVARKYAETHAPVALRREVYEGCLAGLTD